MTFGASCSHSAEGVSPHPVTVIFEYRHVYGDVVWICGKRIDDRFKITPATRRVLKLEFSATSHA